MTIKVLGIDLGKRYFHVHGVDSNGILVTRKKLKRTLKWTYMERTLKWTPITNLEKLSIT